MDKIDLTLRKEFTSNPSRRDQYDDTMQYNNALDYKDQRRSKLDILGFDDFKFKFGIIDLQEHHAFFGDKENKGWEELKLHEAILNITGLLTKTLKLEYDAGYGSEYTCDCCGGFRSSILNSQKYGLCDRCERHSKYRNEKFWERKETLFEETWID